MKYLRKFETEADVNMSVTPNVVLVGDTGRVIYNVFKGVFIQHIDGSLYTIDEWTAKGFANNEANGVAVCDPRASFVIAPTQASSMMVWSSDASTLVDGVIATNNFNIASTDYAGLENTALITDIDASGAAYFCANYTFNNGCKGYLPAMGEWVVAYENKNDINEAMSLIGGVTIVATGNNYWSSTQSNATKAWHFYWYNGHKTDVGTKETSRLVRAFAPLSI